VHFDQLCIFNQNSNVCVKSIFLIYQKLCPIFILSFPVFLDFYGVLGVNTFHARQLSFH